MAALESFEAESFISGEKSHPPKMEKNMFNLNCFLGSENSTISKSFVNITSIRTLPEVYLISAKEDSMLIEVFASAPVSCTF